MNIIARGKAFLQSLRDLANRTVWDWRRCPRCGETDTQKYGFYRRHPWFIDGRQEMAVQRHRCNRCRASYSERSALLVRGSWYAREVRRLCVDRWQHGGGSLRRTAELVRSLLGRQERWLLWRPLDDHPAPQEMCRLSASTVQRWLDGAGKAAQKRVAGQLEGVPTSGQVGVDGLWARLRGKGKRVVLALVDSVSGVIWPPVVVEGEEESEAWGKLFGRAQGAGLDPDALRGVVSDKANGLLSYLQRVLVWVNQQYCVFHLWRHLGGELARQASESARGLSGAAAKAVREKVRRELMGLVRGVVDASSEREGLAAWRKLQAHQLGKGLAQAIKQEWDGLFIHLKRYNRGLLRVAPEWCWRDFRLRLSRGRNHGSEVRLERAALVWQIYHNFTPAQERSERKRHYRRPGKSPLEMAGVPPGEVSYLDALSV
jgi:transposase-like protein